MNSPSPPQCFHGFEPLSGDGKSFRIIESDISDSDIEKLTPEQKSSGSKIESQNATLTKSFDETIEKKFFSMDETPTKILLPTEIIQVEKVVEVAQEKNTVETNSKRPLICTPVVLRKVPSNEPVETINITDDPITITLDDSDDEKDPKKRNVSIEIIENNDSNATPKAGRFLTPDSYFTESSKGPCKTKRRKISSSHFYNLTLNPSFPLGIFEKKMTGGAPSAFEEEITKLVTGGRRSRRNMENQDTSTPKVSAGNFMNIIFEKYIQCLFYLCQANLKKH